MLFYEPIFLFIFFPVVFTVYLALRNSAKGVLMWIALISIIFYLWAEPKFFFLIFSSSILDYWLGRKIAKSNSSKLYLHVGIASNILLLVTFKYTGFIIGEIANPMASHIFGTNMKVPEFILPIGISFLVFEKITYLVDIHRKISPPAESFFKYLFFVFFFPKLLAGPIIKYHEIEPQISKRSPFDAALVAAGFERFLLGVCKKVLIADPASMVSDQIFNTPITQLTVIDSWIGALMFSIQIYFDFSAYSDMAIGIAMMFGFRLQENFNFPYVSIGITEFWRRWHISLSTWIREYLYIPLGGNKISPMRTYLNLFIAFMASGIWHGANWTYIAWGGFHGVFLIAERAFLGEWLKKIPTFIGIGFTFIVVVHSWVLFRSPNIGHAFEYWGKMYDFSNVDQSVYIPLSTLIICGISLIASITSRSWMTERVAAWIETPKIRLFLRTVLAVLFLYSLGKVLTQPFQPFLYFRF